MSQETLTIQNAPRDPAQLATKGAYKLRKLATELQLLNDPTHKSAFINGKPDEMAQVVAAGLRAFDANGAGQAAAAPPPAVQTAAPTINIPGATPTVTTAQPTEAPAAKRGKREPQPSDGSAESGISGTLLKDIKNVLETNTQAINTLATAVLNNKAETDKTLAAAMNAIVAGQRTQNMTLGLLLLIAENIMQDSQANLIEAAGDVMQSHPQVFGGKG